MHARLPMVTFLQFYLTPFSLNKLFFFFLQTHWQNLQEKCIRKFFSKKKNGAKNIKTVTNGSPAHRMYFLYCLFLKYITISTVCSNLFELVTSFNPRLNFLSKQKLWWKTYIKNAVRVESLRTITIFKINFKYLF